MALVEQHTIFLNTAEDDATATITPYEWNTLRGVVLTIGGTRVVFATETGRERAIVSFDLWARDVEQMP